MTPDFYRQPKEYILTNLVRLSDLCGFLVESGDSFSQLSLAFNFSYFLIKFYLRNVDNF